MFRYVGLTELPRVPVRSTAGTGGARCTAVRASGPYLRYGYRRSAPYHVVVHGAHPYRVYCGPVNTCVRGLSEHMSEHIVVMNTGVNVGTTGLTEKIVSIDGRLSISGLYI